MQEQEHHLLRPQPAQPKPWRTMALVMAVIIVVELLIMLLFAFVPHPHFSAQTTLFDALLDALLLALIVAPVIYRFLLLPLLKHAVSEQRAILALHDELTGLPSRRLFREIAEQQIRLARRNNWHIAMILIDPARISEINQILGYSVGDQVLIALAERLRQSLRQSDIIARLSGDEFGLLLPNVAPDDVDTLAQKITDIITEPFHINEIPVDVGIFAGIALFPDHADTSSLLMRRAHIALSNAKQELESYALFDMRHESKALERLQLFSDIRRAINHEELELHYQAQVSLQNNRIVGAEALLRWRGDTPELAATFIPFAEQIGIIGEITHWVLETAIRQVATWQTMGIDIPVSVNISARDLHGKWLPQRLDELCAQYGVTPEKITIEITESAIMYHPDEAIHILTRLKKRGFGIAIDDFGTGHASLAYLCDIPATELKIDRMFIRDINRSPNNKTLIRSMIHIGREFGMTTIAEGVETAEELAQLQTMGCDVVQGFYLFRPVSVRQFEHHFQQQMEQQL